MLWAVIDPIGSVPVYLAVTAKHTPEERVFIAKRCVLIAGAILLFFIVGGKLVLNSMGVPLSALQISGGVILFVFAVTMIFGESKPDQEVRLYAEKEETAVFPLAVPSIAGPGAMMAVVLLMDMHRGWFLMQVLVTCMLGLILFMVYLLMRLSEKVHGWIGNAGASIISRVMGLILASFAANNVLAGIKDYFNV